MDTAYRRRPNGALQDERTASGDRIIGQRVSENYSGVIRYVDEPNGHYVLKVLDKSISHATRIKLKTYDTILYWTEKPEVVALHQDIPNSSCDFRVKNMHICREIADPEIASMVGSLLRELENEKNAENVSFEKLRGVFLKDKRLTAIYLI